MNDENINKVLILINDEMTNDILLTNKGMWRYTNPPHAKGKILGTKKGMINARVTN